MIQMMYGTWFCDVYNIQTKLKVLRQNMYVQHEYFEQNILNISFIFGIYKEMKLIFGMFYMCDEKRVLVAFLQTAI